MALDGAVNLTGKLFYHDIHGKRNKDSPVRRLMIAGCLAFVVANSIGHADSLVSVRSEVARYLQQQYAAGSIVGAQAEIGSINSKSAKSIRIGQIEPGDPRPVTDSTLFGIASCSKPVASAVVFRLLEEGVIKLDAPISRYLPAFSKARLQNGTPVRSPTIQELLSHRSGIYSQHANITAVQTKAIRDFRLSLDESVAIIAEQPLVSAPSKSYAYSGAGYCVLGSVAEKASKKPFEELLQSLICQPIGMTSTTYFPNSETFAEIACGGVGPGRPGVPNSGRPNDGAPHKRGKELRLPLIGGSLYTTATDMGKFARMILAKGQANDVRVLSPEAWRQLTSQPYANQAYGFGWRLYRAGGTTTGLSHNGSLPPYQSMIRISLTNQRYVVIHWTLSDPRNGKKTQQIRDALTKITS